MNPISETLFNTQMNTSPRILNPTWWHRPAAGSRSLSRPSGTKSLRLQTLLAAGLILSTHGALAASVASGEFKADLDPSFPGLHSYSFAGNEVSLPANNNPVVLINGAERRPEVRYVQTGPDTADYQLAFKDIDVTMTARFTMSQNALTITLTDIRETGALAVRTIEIPGLVLVAGAADAEVALGNLPASSYASEKPEDHDYIGRAADLEFKDNEKNPTKNRDANGNRGASYVFVSNGKLVAGMYSTVLDENLRMMVNVTGTNAGRTISARPGKWTWREIPTETVGEPVAKLIVTGDENGDGKVTWQDGAMAYRRNTPHPYGGEKTKDYPIAHIAMNFASQATTPFLRELDNAKKIWLYTDGLGQRIQQKGFQSEGHDSSHPDYAGNVGRRQGGREELNFVMRRGHDFNILSGIHINAHEYHKEAKNFSPDIANLNAIGWSWLDESYLTDYRYDSAYGTLYPRLDAMRADLPWLDFVYLDVYYGRGWPGWRMHSKVNALGILQFTEFPGVMERAVVWNHVANDWTQAVWGKGDRSEIARFIYYSEKDTFKHDPLLRGPNSDGFMGWHAEHNLLQTVKSAFTVNLPTKYLQHFQLTRQETNQAWFNNGMHTEVDGQAARIFGPNGQLLNSCRYEKPQSRPVDNLTFIPWNPYTEEKIYHWNDKGGDSTWDLPASWGSVKTAQLYRLTDLGRVLEREIPVAAGKITLTGILANTPYVLYRETPPALPDMQWSEGSPVRDTGFDSHSFQWWHATTPAAVIIQNDPNNGQTELVMDNAAPGEVRQGIKGLTPGQTYTASAWVSITGKRDATLAVEPGAPTAPPFMDKQSWKIISSTKSPGSDRPLRALDSDDKTAWQTVSNTVFPHEITIGFGKELTLEGFAQTARSDLGNGTIKGYEAWTSLDNKKWMKAAQGEFSYASSARNTVKFDKPVPAKFFRLLATSELKNRPFTSIAELDMLTAPAAVATDPLKTVANTINRTWLTNFTDASSKYMRNWHRLKATFTAPANGRVELALRAGAGIESAAVRFDDVRLVKTAISHPPKGAKNVVLFEDFENVDEGWGPFMYGWEGPMNTHLSEANPPYTDDTISGQYSLKSRKEASPGMLYRTVPALLKLQPDTTYRISLDYLCDTTDGFALVAGSDGDGREKIAFKTPMGDGSWKVRKFSTTFTTDDQADWFIGVTKLEKKKSGTIVIDNLLVEDLGTSSARHPDGMKDRHQP